MRLRFAASISAGSALGLALGRLGAPWWVTFPVSFAVGYTTARWMFRP